MASFNLSAFVQNPTFSEFEKCTKGDLHAVAGHYGIPVTEALSKVKPKAVLLDELLSRKVAHLQETLDSPDSQVHASDSVLFNQSANVTPLTRPDEAARQPATLAFPPVVC